MGGIYVIEAVEVTQEQKAANEIWIQGFGERVEAVHEASKDHGWDSPECQLARMDLFDWQQIRRKERDNGSQIETFSNCG